jgi:hypothetical protein
MLPHAFGRPYITHASFTRYRAGKLSVPSTMTSNPSTSVFAFVTEKCASNVSTRTSGFSASIRDRADSSFDRPTSGVPWII